MKYTTAIKYKTKINIKQALNTNIYCHLTGTSVIFTAVKVNWHFVGVLTQFLPVGSNTLPHSMIIYSPLQA